MNKKRISKNYDAFIDAVEKMKRVLPTGSVDSESVLELVLVGGKNSCALFSNSV